MENAKIVVRKMDLIKCGTVVRITDMLGQSHDYPVRQLRKPTEKEINHLKGISGASKQMLETYSPIIIEQIPGQISNLIYIDMNSNGLAGSVPKLNELISYVAEGYDLKFE